MECKARIIRERKAYSPNPDKKPVNAILVYCPVFGELAFTGDKAKEIADKLSKKESLK
ncbi:MAG: hypothetical protein SV062_08460 [Thermodesulfobacteriota bacterium]|nr:hypothetical protein [Thermodesulfobacteriota bacterium]